MAYLGLFGDFYELRCRGEPQGNTNSFGKDQLVLIDERVTVDMASPHLRIGPDVRHRDGSSTVAVKIC